MPLVKCFICKKEIYRMPCHLKFRSVCSKECKNKLKSIETSQENNYFWKGGKTNSLGYILIKSPNHPFAGVRGYVAEHRLVMEEYIGRLVTKNEVVHHINGIKSDNRIENLQLMTISEHRKLHTTGKKRPEHSRKMKQLWKNRVYENRINYRDSENSLDLLKVLR